MAEKWWTWGRFVYSIPLLLTGLIYMINPEGTVETFPSFIPGELRLIYIAGFLWVILATMIAFNIKAKYASYGVLILLGFYHMMINIPAIYTGEYMNVVWFELLRNLSLMGGALVILGVINHQEEEAKEHELQQDRFRTSIHP